MPAPAKLDSACIASYDAMATEILSNTNIQGPTGHSHQDLQRIICHMMDWEDFDLIEDDYCFGAVYDSAVEKHVIAHIYLAYLRNTLFGEARKREVGPRDFHIYGSVYHEYWYKKLLDRLIALKKGDTVIHPWLH